MTSQRTVLVSRRETFNAAQRNECGGDILFTGYIAGQDLPALYSGAVCFVYPSYFEGFGLPPLEAMQCGTPVIVGNRTSLPEVVADAGLLVDPFEVGEIAAALARVIDNPDLRQELRVKGLQRASEFTWQATARRTLEVYEQVASRQGLSNQG